MLRPVSPSPNYEVPVPKDSPLIGKSIGELKFWQSTGGTIVAIRRGQTVILSPVPMPNCTAATSSSWWEAPAPQRPPTG